MSIDYERLFRAACAALSVWTGESQMEAEERMMATAKRTDEWWEKNRCG